MSDNPYYSGKGFKNRKRMKEQLKKTAEDYVKLIESTRKAFEAYPIKSMSRFKAIKTIVKEKGDSFTFEDVRALMEEGLKDFEVHQIVDWQGLQCLRAHR